MSPCCKIGKKRGSKGQPPLRGGLGASPSLFFSRARRAQRNFATALSLLGKKRGSKGQPPLRGGLGASPSLFFSRARRAQRNFASLMRQSLRKENESFRLC